MTVRCSEPLTITPIKHVIVLIGENRTFDHTFGTYVPRPGQKVSNLLPRGSSMPTAPPGRTSGSPRSRTRPGAGLLRGAESKAPYALLPAPTTGGSPIAPRDTAAPFVTIAEVAERETDLDPADYVLLTTGATGLPVRTLDTRVTNAITSPTGPSK